MCAPCEAGEAQPLAKHREEACVPVTTTTATTTTTVDATTTITTPNTTPAVLDADNGKAGDASRPWQSFLNSLGLCLASLRVPRSRMGRGARAVKLAT